MSGQQKKSQVSLPEIVTAHHAGQSWGLTPESVALKSSASSGSATGLDCSGLLTAPVTKCLHCRVRSKLTPLHPSLDSTAPLRRGRSRCPGWISGVQVNGSQELSGKEIQGTGQAKHWFCVRKGQWTGGSLERSSEWFATPMDWFPTPAKKALYDLLLGQKVRINVWPQFELIGKMTLWFVRAIG